MWIVNLEEDDDDIDDDALGAESLAFFLVWFSTLLCFTLLYFLILLWRPCNGHVW
jgi:hypothetical protein